MLVDHQPPEVGPFCRICRAVSSRKAGMRLCLASALGWRLVELLKRDERSGAESAGGVDAEAD